MKSKSHWLKAHRKKKENLKNSNNNNWLDISISFIWFRTNPGHSDLPFESSSE